MPRPLRRIFAFSTCPYVGLFDDVTSGLVKLYVQEHCGKGLSPQILGRLQEAINWLLSGLWDSERVGTGSVIIPLGKVNFRGAPYGYSVTKTALRVLAKAKLIQLQTAPAGLREENASEIFAAKKLKKRFSRQGIGWAKREYLDDPNVLIIRLKDDFLDCRYQLEVPDNPVTRQMRTDVHVINRASLNYAAFPYLPDRVLLEMVGGKGGNFCNFSQTIYRRIFALGRIDRGGRFYGAWWQMIPREYRGYIRINDEQTEELDFGSTALTILYASRGLSPPVDSYDIGLFKPEEKEKRELVKKFVNALLNTPYGRYGLSKSKSAVLGVTNKELTHLVIGKHQKIADQFLTGIGLELMYRDSEIASEIMLTFARMNIPILCIHDGFIVAQQHLELLRLTMFQVFRKHTGINPSIKQEVRSSRRYRGTYKIYERYMQSVRSGFS